MRNPLVSKIPTPEAQGPGSFIEFRRFTYGEGKAIRAEIDRIVEERRVATNALLEVDPITEKDRRAALQETASKASQALDALLWREIFDRLEGWNWKDGEGRDLQLPKQESELDTYTQEEVDFLLEAIGKAIRGELDRSPEEQKN